MNTETPVIRKSFVSHQEKSVLSEWLLGEFAANRLVQWNVGYYMAGYKFGDPKNQTWPKDGKRMLLPLQNTPPEFFAVRDRIIEEAGFHGFFMTKGNTAFGNLFVEGGSIEPHKDSGVEHCWHVRCNVLLSKSEGGGELVIADKTYEVDEGDLICFLADKHVHEVRPVIGSKKRILISYPMVMPKSWFEND